MNINVTKDTEVGKRIDVYLTDLVRGKGLVDEFDFTNISRESIKNFVLPSTKVNKKGIKPSYRLKKGDTISLPDDYLRNLHEQLKGRYSDEIEPQKGKLDIVYENDDYLVINKAKDIPVHPGSGNPSDTLANYVKGYLTDKNSYDETLNRAGIVHRIDKSVSGLIVFAKNSSFQIELQKQFENHEVLKIYLANVEKLPAVLSKSQPVDKDEFLKGLSKFWADGEELSMEDWYRIDGYIGRDSRNRMKMRFSPETFGSNSKSATTFIREIEATENTLLVRIITGRMHQIRVTLSSLGSSIIGDSLYGEGRELPKEIGLESVFLGFLDKDGKKVSYKL